MPSVHVKYFCVKSSEGDSVSHEILTAVFQIMALHFGILQFHTGVDRGPR